MTKLAQFPGLMILTLILLAVAGMTNTSYAATAQISAAGNHTLALKADGTLWGWGDNTFGQIGDGSQISRNAPVRIGVDSDWTDIAAGFYHSVALKADGSLWTWGDNTKGQLGDGATSASRSVPVKIGTGTNWTSIAAGDFHSLALKADGTLWAWGDNGSGQAGTGAVVPGTLTAPVQIGTATDWTAIAAGGSHSFGLKTDHTLWGWGSNGVGQLGNGAVIDANAPVQIKPPPPFINTDWSAVAAGRAQSAAIKQDGTLWSWGDNSVVRPLNMVLYVNVPTRQTGGAASWIDASAADSHILGRGSDGTLWSWGENENGQLGHGNNFDAAVPGKIGIDTDWIKATAGSAHSVAMKANGTVWSWGDNSFGQLGDGTNSPKNAPVQTPLNTLLPQFTITAAAAANGTISPSGSNSVSQGTSQTYTIIPDTGFLVTALVVDGTLLPGAVSYTFTNVTADHYINAYFAPSDITLTAAAGPNGSISPAGTAPVTPGSSQSYTITPVPGFMVAALVVDGVQLPAATTYTFTDITNSHYINAYFAPSDVILTAAAGPNGSISPAGAAPVTPGSSQNYSITPNAGFMAATLVVDGSQLPGAASYTFSNVSSSHYINAYFAPLPATVTVTAAAGPNGSISPAGANPVPWGSSQTYTITPDNGFTVTALVVDGTLLPGATSYTFTNVTEDHYINAYFQ